MSPKKIIDILLFIVALIYLVLSSYDPGRTGKIYQTQSIALLISLTASTVFLWLISRPIITKPQLGLIFFVIFAFLLSIISATFGEYSGAFSGTVNNFIGQLLILLIFISLANANFFLGKDWAKPLAMLLVCFAVITALVGWQALITGTGLFGAYSFTLPLHHQFRLTGFHSSSNYSGLALALGVVSTVYLIAIVDGISRNIWIILLILLTASLLATGSRGSILIGFSVVLVFSISSFRIRLPLKFRRLKTRNVLNFCVFAGIICSILFLVLNSQFSEFSLSGWTRLLTRTERAGGLDGEARVIFLMDGLRYYQGGSLFQQFFGFGNGAFEELVFGYSPHNSYLLILFDRGLTNLFLLLVFLVFAFVTIIFSHLPRSTKSFFLSLMVLAVFRGLFQSSELLSMGLNWNVVMFVVITSLSATRTNSNGRGFSDPRLLSTSSP
jgi:hypothetical protein